MNRPRLVGVLSTVFGSTAGFLVLSYWHLAGTVTGAILMPVIFTFVAFCSHEFMEHAGEWVSRRVNRGSPSISVEPLQSEETSPPGGSGLRARTLQWSIATLAFLAFAVSLYTLTQEDSADVTILREKVVETVTVTTEQSPLSVARGDTPRVPTVTVSGQTKTGEPSPTTTTEQAAQEDATTTTTSTLVDSTGGSTTTVP